MKEATGELNMTVITLVAISALAAVFYFVLWPIVQRQLVDRTCKSSYGTNYQAVKRDGTAADTSSQATVSKWACCTSSTYNAKTCKDQ